MTGTNNGKVIRNEIAQLADIRKTSPVEILCVDGTKLDWSFLNAQVDLADYRFPHFWRDQNPSGGKIVYIRNGIIAKIITLYETQNMESIWVDITVKKRNWGVLFADRSSHNNNIKQFYDETNQSKKFYQNLTILLLQVILTKILTPKAAVNSNSLQVFVTPATYLTG